MNLSASYFGFVRKLLCLRLFSSFSKYFHFYSFPLSLVLCDNYFPLSLSSTSRFISNSALTTEYVPVAQFQNLVQSICVKTLTIYSLTILANICVGHHSEITLCNRFSWLRFIAVRPARINLRRPLQNSLPF